MLNLLRYAEPAGREIYMRYAQVAGGSISAVGGSLIYMAPVIQSVEAWDTAVLVYYPSPSAYLEMQSDPEYRAAIPDRTAGLDARLLYPFALGDMSGEDAAARAATNGEEVMAIRLRADRENVDLATTGDIVFRLSAVGAGLVSDSPWGELEVERFKSIAEFQRAAQSSDALSVLTQVRIDR